MDLDDLFDFCEEEKIFHEPSASVQSGPPVLGIMTPETRRAFGSFVHIQSLPMSCCSAALRELRPPLVIIEACYQTCWPDWSCYAAVPEKRDRLLAFLQEVKRLGIPSLFLFTLRKQEAETFSAFAALATRSVCATPEACDALRAEGASVEEIPQPIDTRSYNPLVSPGLNTTAALFPMLVSMHQNPHLCHILDRAKRVPLSLVDLRFGVPIGQKREIEGRSGCKTFNLTFPSAAPDALRLFTHAVVDGLTLSKYLNPFGWLFNLIASGLNVHMSQPVPKCVAAQGLFNVYDTLESAVGSVDSSPPICLGGLQKHHHFMHTHAIARVLMGILSELGLDIRKERWVDSMPWNGQSPSGSEMSVSEMSIEHTDILFDAAAIEPVKARSKQVVDDFGADLVLVPARHPEDAKNGTISITDTGARRIRVPRWPRVRSSAWPDGPLTVVAARHELWHRINRKERRANAAALLENAQCPVLVT